MLNEIRGKFIFPYSKFEKIILVDYEEKASYLVWEQGESLSIPKKVPIDPKSQRG